MSRLTHTHTTYTLSIKLEYTQYIYFKLPCQYKCSLSWILGYLSSNHLFRIPMAAHTLNILSRRNKNTFIFYSINACSQYVDICLFFLFANHTSHVFVTNPFARHLTKFHIYFYILRKHCHTHKDGGVLEYPYQDSVGKIPSRKYKNIFLENFPVQIFPLFL